MSLARRAAIREANHFQGSPWVLMSAMPSSSFARTRDDQGNQESAQGKKEDRAHNMSQIVLPPVYCRWLIVIYSDYVICDVIVHLHM